MLTTPMQRTISVFIVAMATLFVGCSGRDGAEVYPVSGTVSFNGEPVKLGDIVFEPETTGLAADGGQIVDGKYQCQAKAGRLKVRITASREIPGKSTVGAMGEKLGQREEYIPAQFNSNTELIAEVDESPDNKIDFDLKAEGGANSK